MAKINWLLFCDKVKEGVNDKHDLIGVHDALLFHAMPATQKKWMCVYELELSGMERGFLHIAIHNKTVNVDIFESAPRLCSNGVGELFSLVASGKLENIQFGNFGEYSLDVYFDRVKIHSASFRVLPIYSPAPQSKARLN